MARSASAVVRVMQVNPHAGTVDKLVDTVPDVIDKVTGIVKGGKKEKETPQKTE